MILCPYLRVLLHAVHNCASLMIIHLCSRPPSSTPELLFPEDGHLINVEAVLCGPLGQGLARPCFKRLADALDPVLHTVVLLQAPLRTTQALDSVVTFLVFDIRHSLLASLK